MIRKAKSLINKNRVLLENFSFLSILQVSNLLIFLLMIPYLYRVLGKEYYGIVVFAQTVAIYFAIIVNFGFNVTATRDISIYRNNRRKVSKIISSIITLKLIFFFFTLIILSILVSFIHLFSTHPKIFFFSMLFCLSEALFPIWYFQGIEKMKYITFINVATRITSALLIFVFVKHHTDYILIPIFLGMGTVMGAIIGLIIVFYVHKNKFLFLHISELKTCVVDNLPLFISNVSSQIYVNANKLIVGSFLGMQDVAIYDIADKIVNLLKVPVFLVKQTLFPRVSKDRDVRFVKRAMGLVFVFFAIVYILLFTFTYPIIHLFSGSSNQITGELFRFLAISILPICLGLFFAELILVPFGFLKDYTKMRTSSLFVYLVIVGLLIVFKQVGLFQLAGSIIFVETFVLLYSFYLCKKNKVI